MSHLSLRNVTKEYGAIKAVNAISFDVPRGERLALLGPSGCGKTTTLNMIAGFIPVDAGEIFVGGKNVSAIPAHKRNMGMVFQNYALFPHLSAARNIAFGLEIRGVGKEEIERRVREALALVQLENVDARYPRQLSGGQQQRVAVARALVIRPDILLLDEPLSNLDAKLRHEMRAELVYLLKNVGITTIFVTHDQAEALVLSDQIAVLNEGRIEQIGTPKDIYERPETAFVAKFLGDTNVLTGRVVDSNYDGVNCAIGPGINMRSSRRVKCAVGDKVEILIRAERIKVSAGERVGSNSAHGILEQVIYLGSDIQYMIRLGDFLLTAVDKNRISENLIVKMPVTLEWRPGDVFVSPIAATSEIYSHA